MARIRSVKPEFWADGYLATHTSRETRLLYVALWNLADEHGRLRGDTRYLKGQVFAYDDDIAAWDIDVMLEELAKIRRVRRYEVDGEHYLFLPKLAAHQRLEPAKAASRHPEPPAEVDADESVDDDSPSPAQDRADLPGGLSSSMEHVAGTMEHGTGEGETPSSELAPRADVDHLCDLLAGLVEANGSKRPAVTESWRKSCRLLLDRDGKTAEQVENAIRWSQANEFWRGNVLSMPKLREKYDQLRLAALRPANVGGKPSKDDKVASTLQRARELEAQGL